MDPLFPVDVVFRWLHVGTAIVVVGGSFFLRFVLSPAAAELPDDQHDLLRDRVLGTWKKIVHVGILLFLLSGFYNYFRAMGVHKGDGLYHALVGTKIILAFVVFFIASALIGRSAKFEAMRQNRKKWLGVIVLLAGIIVAISGFVKIRGTSTPDELSFRQSDGGGVMTVSQQHT